jgi:large subunit ribosomal protein L13
MKIIDGKDATMGRLAAYAAKEALKGEDVTILNCDKMIITGNKADIKENFLAKRRRVGSTQKGPKISRNPERIVRRVIRGMLPNYRGGRGRVAFKRIKCHNGVPPQFQDAKKIVAGRHHQGSKFMFVEELGK